MWKIILIFFNLNLSKFALSQQNWSKDVYVPNSCVCATSGNCEIASTGGSADGSGSIDARIMTASNGQIITGTVEEVCKPVSSGIPIVSRNQTTCRGGLDRCCSPMGFSCGLRYPPVNGAPKPFIGSGQAEYGAYPWHVVILINSTFYASGVLIDQKHVLTVAHRFHKINDSSKLQVRMGEYDLLSQSVPIPKMTSNVSELYIHPQFTLRNLKNNVALLTLSTPVELGRFPTITNICLPNTTVSDIYCFVSGWGQVSKNIPGNQRVILESDVPLVNHSMCQSMLRQTRLGSDFMLDKNQFVCAGGESGKDACIGDGGAPLSCYLADRFYLIGLAAWGIGCGETDIPGVYVNVLNFIPWIQKTIREEAALVTTTLLTPSVAASRSTTPIQNSSINRSSTRSVANTTKPNTVSSVSATTSRGVSVSGKPLTTVKRLITSSTRTSTRRNSPAY